MEEGKNFVNKCDHVSVCTFGNSISLNAIVVVLITYTSEFIIIIINICFCITKKEKVNYEWGIHLRNILGKKK